MRLKIRISARSSHLAKLQAYEVGRELQKKNSQLEIDYFFRESIGDKNLSDPLWKMPEKGVFTEDFYADLIDEKTDLVVHSWKDLPTERRPDTTIYATLPRADQRDVLLFKKSSRDRLKNEKQATIFTSSQRRSYNLKKFLLTALPFQPINIKFENIRGNIPTRLEKLMRADSIDGLVLAKAALDRLLTFEHADFAELQKRLREILRQCDLMVLPLTENPNAAAQGALAIEIKKSRDDLKSILDEINDARTFEAAQKERDVLSSFGGGCHQKIGISFLSRPYGWVQFLKGETVKNEILDVQRILSPVKSQKLPSEKFTLSAYKNLFERIEVEYSIPKIVNALFVSRISAYRDFEGFIWTAGLETWKQLAAKDVWVHGSSESLGENEDPRLQALSEQKLIWAKLSHLQAEESAIPMIPTYKLRMKSDWPKAISEAKNFFWMSVFHFDEAVKVFPEIRNRIHCSGPGQTHRALKKRLEQTATEPYVFLNEKDWKENG